MHCAECGCEIHQGLCYCHDRSAPQSRICRLEECCCELPKAPNAQAP